MPNILLSFCIPTYNRSHRIAKIIEQLIPLSTNEFEIVISDNASTDKTAEIVRSYDDPRIKYFRNKKNVGMDANFLLVIKRASGKFIYLLMDEDDVAVDNIPWVLEQIKNDHQNKLSQICGSIGDKRPRFNGDFDKTLEVTRDQPRKFEDILIQRYLFNKNYSRSNIRFRFKDEYYKKGRESLRKLLFYYPHGSGIILRKNNLNLEKAKKYIGISFMHQTLIAQALIHGDTLSTSKIVACFGKTQFESRQDLFKGKQWWHPLSKLNQTKYRIELIYDITQNLDNPKDIRRELLQRQYQFIYTNLLILLFSHNTWNFAVLSSDFQFKYVIFNIIPLIKSMKDFLEGISIIMRIRKFWNVIYYFISKFFRVITKEIINKSDL